MVEKKQGVVAIDGPSGSGKSTVARSVAQKLNILYVDTGAMFRGIACYWSENELLNEKNQEVLQKSLQELNFIYNKSSDSLIEINGKDYTKRIREHSISKMASDVSKNPFVRDYLLKIQRELAESRLCIMEGRDIGTVVFPKSFCKVFLTASLEERTQRRYDDLKEKGQNVDFERLKKDLENRDLIDSTRDVAPLKQAEDAFYLDSSSMVLEDVVTLICDRVRENASNHGFTL